jgi:hypothetical protein
MANLQFNVDTRPMAESVDGARSHLNGITVAVTAMEAAVIAAELKSAQTISENVDNGFYMLIKSQISQKTVAAYTEMTSMQITLLQLSKALENVKRQMEGDFNMITRRYSKLFQSLNKALETRVKELDRPAMQLADIRKTMISDKHKDNSSMLFFISDEALPLVQTSLSGKMKQKTRDTIRILAESVYENNSYSKKIDSILVKNSDDFCGNADLFYLPALLFVSESLLNPEDYIENVYTAKSEKLQNISPIVSEINRIHNNFNWMSLDGEEKAHVRKEFLALCEKETSSTFAVETESLTGGEKITKEMLRLFDNSVWEDCKK